METTLDGNAAPADPKGGTPGAAPAAGDKVPVTAQLRGEVLAYAMQSAVCGLGTSFLEPYINHSVQKQYAKDPSHHAKYGSYTQNLGGELIGDLAGAATLMTAELLFPEQLHSNSRKVRKCIDPLYDTVAHRVFASEKGAPDYDKKIEEWKTFQERNLVRSLIIATGSIVGNVASQKYLIGNPAPGKTIFAGKLFSTSLTTAMGLCVRMAFPKQMDALDERMSKKYFAPMLKGMHMDGAAEAVAQTPVDDGVFTRAERLRKKTDDYMRLQGFSIP